mmetsp:Transcript_55022/g.130152  ORF Transcript_55022/g.130152 Transcript_55022/m.130152 type:complete len:283 (-) Transcript_55022:1011-1859(-)
MRERAVEEPGPVFRQLRHLPRLPRAVPRKRRSRTASAQPGAAEHGRQTRSGSECQGRLCEKGERKAQVQMRRLREEASGDGVRDVRGEVLRRVPRDLPSQRTRCLQGARSSADGAGERAGVRRARGPGPRLLLHTVRGDGVRTLPADGDAHRAPAREPAHGRDRPQGAADRRDGDAGEQARGGARLHAARRRRDADPLRELRPGARGGGDGVHGHAAAGEGVAAQAARGGRSPRAREARHRHVPAGGAAAASLRVGCHDRPRQAGDAKRGRRGVPGRGHPQA